MRFFFLRNNNKKRRKICSEHTCTFSTSVINTFHFVKCSWSVLSKTSGHLLLSRFEFMRMSLISALAMLERLQFYFIPVARVLAASFCLPGQRKKSPCAMNKRKMTSDIYFCYFYRRLQNKCKTPRRAWLADGADYSTRIRIFRDSQTCGNCQSSWVKDFQIVKAFWKPQDRAASSEETNTPKMYFNKVSTFKSSLYGLHFSVQIGFEPFRKSDSSYWYRPLQNLLPLRKASPWIYCCRLEAGTKGN